MALATSTLIGMDLQLDKLDDEVKSSLSLFDPQLAQLVKVAKTKLSTRPSAVKPSRTTRAPPAIKSSKPPTATSVAASQAQNDLASDSESSFSGSDSSEAEADDGSDDDAPAATVVSPLATILSSMDLDDDGTIESDVSDDDSDEEEDEDHPAVSFVKQNLCICGLCCAPAVDATKLAELHPCMRCKSLVPFVLAQSFHVLTTTPLLLPRAVNSCTQTLCATCADANGICSRCCKIIDLRLLDYPNDGFAALLLVLGDQELLLECLELDEHDPMFSECIETAKLQITLMLKSAESHKTNNR